MSRWRLWLSALASAVMRATRFRLVPLHTTIYRLSGGRVIGRFYGTRLLLLTTHGRRSGKPHTVPLAFIPDEDGYIVGDGAAGWRTQPDWYRNLAADPSCEVQVGRRRFAARARSPDPAGAQVYADRFITARPDTARYPELAGRPIDYVLLCPATST